MIRSPLNLHEEGLTLVFGPQGSNITKESTKKLRSTLLETVGLQWTLDVLTKLPQDWQSISKAVPELKAGAGEKHLKALVEWLRKGDFPDQLFPLPNAIIAPLEVVSHLAQYFAFLHQLNPGLASGDSLQASLRWPTETVGLRTGLLSSAAVAVSANLAQLETHGATAIRIAMAVGAVMDAENIGSAKEAKEKSVAHICDSDLAFQFPKPSRLALTCRSVTGEEYKSEDILHRAAARVILTDQADLDQLFKSVQSSLHQRSLLVAFGHDQYVPEWVIRELGPRLLEGRDFDLTSDLLQARFDRFVNHSEDDAIAVVGMACHLPGGDDLNSFWNTLCDGKSQHVEVPADRVDFQTATWRDNDPNKKWYGNFVKDHDAFDHRFFKKSSREMASTDPQQRLIMQVAYQAVEQSGYFSMPTPDMNIGCYVGIGVTDYENNVACHPATAYTATGNLKPFASGKISHYFGWSGPGVSFDTACSSSAVAIHYACQAILTGECTSALAGGTNVMTGPEWFQNLDGAAFLSATGQCKPFDVKADGYCRGEGAGAVFLKKLSTAIKDGNQVLGVINASSVNQNENCSAITAPSVLSLSDVFSTVIRKARLDPKQISVVEAHGTGTQVGDRAEYESIRKILGGPARQDNLTLGSVKGLIGHLECASGIAALIKTLLMMSKNAIPPQPSFQALNPKLNASPADKIDINTTMTPWKTDFKAVLLNNYGASGSNASIVVTKPVYNNREKEYELLAAPTVAKRPFWLCGLDQQSLKSYASKLLQLLSASDKGDDDFSIANLSFQLSRQTNRSLAQALIFSCNSTEELQDKLSAFANGQGDIPFTARRDAPRPVVLCFGGQTSTFVGLDREVYDQFKILRTHLDRCNETCLSLGLDSIFPAIFEQTPAKDVVHLQTMQFALQYSTAKSWIDSGIQIAAVVGHSFGELTAMSVSGVLSVKDALKMVSDRARIIQSKWGSEKGAMMAVEGAQEDVENLLREASKTSPKETAATIACFNGPRSFTLAGSTKAIEQVKNTMANGSFSSIRGKQLNVTNAFHSTLVEPLLTDLTTVGDDLIFREPVIPHEKATKGASSGIPPAGFIASHLRNPVYFNHAVQRLAERYPSSIWLEAGSSSGVTSMASKALGSPKNCHFQAINILGTGGVQQLTDATVSLWKEGLNSSFWAHHVSQTLEYSPVLLPPYQFEKSKHWLENKKVQPKVETVVEKLPEAPKGLWTFSGYQDDSETQARFEINTTSEKYLTYVSAHVIAQTAPICPSAFQYAIAMEALMSLLDEEDASSLEPELQEMESNTPMCLDPSRTFWLDAERYGSEGLSWEWRITSSGANDSAADSTLHVSGRILFRNLEEATYDFSKFERLADRQRCLALLDGPDVDQVIQGGRNLYKAFAEVVQYNHEEYKGMQKVTCKGNEAAARVIRENEKDYKFNVGLVDTFCQVAGVFWNCMIDREDSEMFLSNKVDQWIRSPTFPHDSKPKVWELYVRHHQSTDKEAVSDVFVFDPASGKVAWVILGLRFVKVSRNAISRLLARLSPGCKVAQGNATPPAVSAEVPTTNAIQSAPTSKARSVPPSKAAKKKKTVKKSAAPQRDISGGLNKMLCNLLGLDADDIKPSSDLIELGIDSLLAMEVAREVENEFKTKLETDELVALTDFQSLVTCVSKKLGVSDATGNEEEDEADDSDNDGGILTPADSATTTKNGISLQTNGVSTLNGDLTNGHIESSEGIPSSLILDTFGETKRLTDQYVKDNKLSGYTNNVLPKHNELVVVHIIDAFEQMGCPLRTAEAGTVLERVKYLSKHEQVIAVFYVLLEKARVVDLEGSKIIRTDIPVPPKSAATLVQELIREHPDHTYDYKLTSLVGDKLGDCLTGKTEATQVLFGTAEGRELTSGWYGTAPANTAWIGLMQNFWKQLLLHWPKQNEPIRVLEMGAGTGGTTSRLASIFADSGVPFVYTVTDISPSLVAGLRKRFKHHPTMKFEVMNLEKAPAADFLHSQHAILATNCVHATQSLATTTKNIHEMLRPDGFLLMLEMTQLVPWIDLVFGVVDGWWLFNDGRVHALVDTTHWEKSLQATGFGHVDWSDGNLPESSIQRIIISLASGPSYDRVPILPSPPSNNTADFISRQAVVDSYVDKHSHGFSAPLSRGRPSRKGNLSRCVVVTGATGSLGSHLVAHFASQPNIHKVICLNRISSAESTTRQRQSLESRGIFLPENISSKLQILETDSTKPNLGLSSSEYEALASSVTDIVHNAWPMSLTRPVRAFEPQFKTMRNLIDFARECANRQPIGTRIGFQLVSSIAVVGNYPFVSGDAVVPECKMATDAVLPIGYAEAKLVCEYLINKTLRQYPEDFHAMAIRVGQIAGSKTNGYWNPVEHLAQLIKSSQTLRALPAMQGTLSWYPANDVAATFGDLLLGSNKAYPIYHLENPVRQPWPEMIRMLAEVLQIPEDHIIPYKKWVRRIRDFPPTIGAAENPAAKLADFFSNDFTHMSSGGLILDTLLSKEHSETMRSSKPVGKELVAMYIQSWKDMGFLR